MGWQFNMYGVDIAGKTGTSNDNRDGWFMCITPNLVAGAWVGAEDQSIHLRRRGEGSVMALPIVGDFLQRVHNDERCRVSRDDKFVMPPMWQLPVCDELSGTTQSEAEFKDEFFE
jgi:penicillin-binding protein 1A